MTTQIKCSDTSDTPKTDAALNIPQLLEYIDRNFNLLKKDRSLVNFLPILQYTLKLNLVVDSGTDITTHISELIRKHKDDQAELVIVLQLLYQILKISKDVENSVFIFGNPFLALIDLLFATASRKVNANILACLKLYAGTFKASRVMEKLWERLRQPDARLNSLEHKAQIIAHLFDEFMSYIQNFHRDRELFQLVQALLTSTIREERKSGYFLLKKISKVVIKQASERSDWEIDSSAEAHNCWTVYIKILELLEANQTHLVLPFLRIVKSLENQRLAPKSWAKWMNILYIKILNINDASDNRWVLEYFLETFTCGDLNSEVLSQFLKALNNTSLYNIEGYFLKEEHIPTFLKFDQTEFLDMFAKVSWESVPLHFWLSQLKIYGKPLDHACKGLVLKIAAKVRVLRNRAIRQKSIQLVEDLFSPTIDEMDLCEYINFIETIYNVNDPYTNYEVFTRKIKKCEALVDGITFSRGFYEILTNNLNVNDQSVKDMLSAILKFLAKEPRTKHNWLRFMLVCDSEYSDELREFCETKYNIDLLTLGNAGLDTVTKEFRLKLVCHSDDEEFVRTKALEFFVCRSLNEFDSNYGLEKLLKTGSYKILLKLSSLLVSHKEKVSISVLDAMVDALNIIMKQEHLNLEKVATNILEYCKAMLPESLQQYVNAILILDLENWNIRDAVYTSFGSLVSDELIMKGIMFGDATTGDDRIEEAYNCAISHTNANSWKLRRLYRLDINVDLVNDLINLNNALSRRTPLYSTNSTEHRLKMRIALALTSLITFENCSNYCGCVESLFSIALNQLNEPNIAYLYEALTAMCIPNIDFVLTQLQEVGEHTARQKKALISIVHFYCEWKLVELEVEKLNKVVSALLPLILGEDFNVRHSAQFAMYQILDKCSKIRKNISLSNQIMTAIEQGTVGVDLDYLRMNLYEFRHDIYNIVMHITKAPFDEYDYFTTFKKFMPKKIDMGNTTIQQSLAKETGSPFDRDQPGTELNSALETLLKDHNLSQLECKEKEIYVVASLVSKLPNLGGIARTCEVLGIKNLVMVSKNHAKDSEFQQVSLSAEKKLNILEVKRNSLNAFLVQKQREGFEIVGAEQTARSKCFIDFKFPKKCVLLLGHEKDGIPSENLRLLDHAVEIPQFGIVRSLNVHVTGALFMWEYCKQHFMTNES